MTDHLERLYTDGAFEKERVSKLIQPYVAIDRDENIIILKPTAKDSLNIRQQILVYMLTKQLLKEAEKIEEGTCSASEIKSETSLKDGSVDSSFKHLRDDGLIIGSGSDYKIPHYQVNDILDMFEKQQD